MAQRGGLSHINYREKKGLKVGGGQFVKKGVIFTRQGEKWKAGINTAGSSTVYALCDGIVYFTKRKGTYRKTKSQTVINVKPLKQKGS